MSVQHIITLLIFYLKITNFIFQVKYYGQIHGTVMGSYISPNVANLFMEEFGCKTINSANDLPRLWLRYGDDTFVIQKVEHINQFLQHINYIDPHIQLLQETPNTESSIPFLDMLVSQGPDNTLLTTVYRKATPTDQYLP